MAVTLGLVEAVLGVAVPQAVGAGRPAELVLARGAERLAPRLPTAEVVMLRAADAAIRYTLRLPEAAGFKLLGQVQRQRHLPFQAPFPSTV